MASHLGKIQINLKKKLKKEKKGERKKSRQTSRQAFNLICDYTVGISAVESQT